MKNNVIGWFEIPVEDMKRAKTFYEAVLACKLEMKDLEGSTMAWFPYDGKGYGSPGSLVMSSEHYRPGKDGTVVYFTSPSGNCRTELDRVEKAGGRILRPRTKISDEHGYYGLFLDSEENRIGIHSNK